MARTDAPRVRPSWLPPWLPNALSALRIGLIPAWLALAFMARHRGSDAPVASPVLVFMAIGLSDVIDGFVARRFALATNLGATLDAVADKLAQVTAVSFLALLGAPAFTALPLWLMLVLATRDIALGVGWLLVHKKKGEVHSEHRWHGKAASALLFAVISAALVGAPAALVRVGSLLIVVLVVPSTVAYLREGWRQLR